MVCLCKESFGIVIGFGLGPSPTPQAARFWLPDSRASGCRYRCGLPWWESQLPGRLQAGRRALATFPGLP